jgi:hypothetical protein
VDRTRPSHPCRERQALKQADLVVVLVLAGFWVAALAVFPRALEPGRSEETGVTLSASAAGFGKDWFSGSPAIAIRGLADRIDVASTRPGAALLSRSLPVFENECYVADARVQTLRGQGALAVADEEGRSFLAVSAFPVSSAAEERSVIFETVGRRRVSLVILAGRDSQVELSAASIRRIGRSAPCAP